MWIVSKDRIFARALQLVLGRAGFTPIRLTSSLSETAHSPLIIDLDDFECPTDRRSVTFSSHSDRKADLVRPFLTNDLAALCQKRFALEISPPPSEDTDRPALRLTDEGVLLGGQPVSLSPSELALWNLLLAHAGECVPKEEIDRLWKGNGNMTEVYIRYLRKKLDEPSGLRLIRTVRGKGYVLCLPNTSL